MPALLLEVALRAALIALGTACVLGALRIKTADVRHAAWSTVVIAMLLLPVWSVGGAKVPLAVLPANGISLAFDSDSNLAPQPRVTEPDSAVILEAVPAVGHSALGVWAFIGAYLLGASALLVRLAIGTLHAHRLRRTAVVHRGRAISARCATPITVGWLSPVLILPEGWERWSPAHLDAVLTHEHEHVRRHDPLVQWLALLNRAIFWFHPLAWWLERRLATLAEEACDVAVIRAGHSPQDYSAYLIDMARTLSRQGRRLNVGGMAMPGSGLPERLKHILTEVPMTPTPRTRVICTLAFCTTSAVIFATGMLVPRTITYGQPLPVTPVKSEIVLPKPALSEPASPAGRPANSTEQPASLYTRRAVGGSRLVKTDFSGTWTLVSSTYAGRGRGGTGGGLREVKVSIASGAPVNCGTGCTIAQNAATLTLSRSDQPGMTPPDIGEVVLNLDGGESTITQFNGSQYPARAQWEDDKLVVTRDISGRLAVTQILSMEKNKLTVVTTFSMSDAPVTLTYVKQ